MNKWHLQCTRCRYEASVEVGSYTPEESYNDLNEDFSYFKVFVCPFHKGWLYRDVHDRGFDGTCLSDGERLVAAPVPADSCPKCGGAVLSRKYEGTSEE